MSRWGAVSKVLERVNPQAKVFFVGDSDDTGFVNFVNEFQPDKEGVVRVYGSMFDSTMLANCVAGRGDVVMVMPGHSESISTDRAYTTKGLKVIGLGEGDERPIVRYTAATASISLDTGGIQLENFRLITDTTAVTRAVDVVGHGCVVRKNSFEFNGNGSDFAVGVRATGVDRVVVEENEFLGEDTTGATHGVLLNNSDYSKVRKNYIFGQFSVAGIRLDSDASLGVLIEDNKVVNMDTAASISISIVAASNGMVVNNRLATADSTAGALSSIAPGGARWLENYSTDGDSASGILTPVVTSS